MDLKRDAIRTQSGKRLQELTLEAVLNQELTEEDFRISAETLAYQAEAASSAGYHQVAENLRRAAELTRLSNQEVLTIYSMLRPGRASYEQLRALGKRLERELAAPCAAQLIYEAAEAYLARGLVSADPAASADPNSG